MRPLERACWFALLAFAMAACKRAPSEPDARLTQVPQPATASPPSIASSPTPIATATPPRCIRKLANDPPPVSRRATHCPADPGDAPRLDHVRVAFANGITVEAEYAQTEEQTARGLMYRTALDDSRGMLFYLRDRGDHQFWMRNTCIPLDMIFIDEDKTIVGIEENVPTLNEEPRGVGCPSVYVLEMNAGWSRKHGVKPGDRVTF